MIESELAVDPVAWGEVFDRLTEGGYLDEEIILLLQGSESDPEVFTAALTGAVQAVRRKMKPFPIAEEIRTQVIDVCGTGGDAPKTGGSLNISTATAFIVAACGVFVAKHGNRSVSSRSGSADMLEAAGIAVSLSPDRSAELLAEHRLCFLFAPDYHPALRHVAAARKKYGKPSLFNFVGPLCNPARPSAQLIGVFDFSRAEAVRQASGLQMGYIITGGDGSDEPDLSENNQICDMQGTKISLTAAELTAAGVNLTYPPESLRGGSAADNASAFLDLLKNQPGSEAYQDAVTVSAAFALMTAGAERGFVSAARRAREAIISGAAYDVYQKMKTGA